MGRRREPLRYPRWEAILPEPQLDPQYRTGEPEGWWEWPGMFWRWTTGPIRRLVARLRRD